MGRWEEERFDLLQPHSPGVHFTLSMITSEQIKGVGAKELVEMSSGSHSVAGGLNYMSSGV